MIRKTILGALAMAASVAVTPVLGAGSHLQQAIASTEKAIHYGDMPHHESSFAQHIDNALDHAMMAQKAHPNPHIKKAIADLRQGRRIAYDSHSPRRQRAGAARASRALAQLQAAQAH